MMEANSLKTTRWMTHLFLAISAGGILGVAWELKQTIEARSNLEETQFRARSRLEEIRERNPFRPIHRALEKVQTNEASTKLSRLNKTMHELETDLGIKRGEELEKIFVEHKNKIQDATTYSRPDELLKTLSDKVARLEGMALSRRWNNLAKGAQRMDARLTQLKGSGKVESPLVRFMESDLTAMTSLIRGSSLEEADKTEVLRQLEGIRQEIAMLLDLHQSRRGLQEEMSRADAAVGRWAARADLAIGTLKHRANQALQDCLMHIWAMGAFLLGGWMLIGLSWSWASRGQRRQQDQDMMEMLQEGVLGDKPVWENLVSGTRIDEFHKMIRVIKKRLRLGEDFQSAMPFGSVLLDSEGKLIWGNALFAEQFGLDLEELENEFLRWSELSSRLSGPDYDPFHYAMTEMVPGTWQVQLQMNDGVAVPLEMHISPIQCKTGLKALIVFYPLAMMRETIQSQARLVMEPVRLALEALEGEMWGVETEARLAPLWKQAGLSEDWEKLSKALHRMDQTRNTLFKQVSQLEDENHDHLKTIADLTEGLEVRSRALKSQMQGLKDMRDNIVSIDQLGSDLSLEHSALLNGVRAQLKRQDVIIETARGLSERLSQAKEAISALEKFKLDYRIGKQEIQESKQELVNLHNRFLGTLPEMSERSESLAVSMKDALIRMDRATGQLETRLAGMDIQITKLAMTFVGPTPEFERGTTLDLAAHERVAREIREALQEDQEMIVERLRKLVEDLRQDAQAFTALRESIAPVEHHHP